MVVCLVAVEPYCERTLGGMIAVGSKCKARKEQEEAASEEEEGQRRGRRGMCVAFILDQEGWMDQCREWHHSDQATRDESRLFVVVVFWLSLRSPARERKKNS
jgi:hypothetical protein